MLTAWTESMTMHGDDHMSGLGSQTALLSMSAAIYAHARNRNLHVLS